MEKQISDPTNTNTEIYEKNPEREKQRREGI